MGASRSRKLTVVFLLLVAFFLIATVQGEEPFTESGRYVFNPDQSTLVQTGGFAGVHWTYAIEGRFCLIVDTEAGAAQFEQVDANAVDTSEPLRTLDPNDAFNLTGLVGAVIDETTIEFTGQAANETDVRLTLTFEDDTVQLLGETIPPPNSADFFLLNLDATATRKYNGGAGEPNHPYLIHTPEQMNAIGADPNDWDRHFRLTADIDLSAYQGTEFRVIGCWRDHPAKKIPFTGVFDGNTHRILNFAWSSDDAAFVGLFGYVDGPRAEIRNLGLIAPRVEVMGGSYNVGSLVGCLSCGKLVDCYAEDGSVRVNWGAGGLVGFTCEGTLIKNCYTTGTVTGTWVTGGLVGCNQGLITNCRSTATVTGRGYTGGLAGGNKRGNISYSCSTGKVVGSHDIGGLVGRNQGLGMSGVITDSYSTAEVVGEQDVGGFLGSRDLGSPGTLVACFWDVETSGQVTSAAGTGLTTADMQRADTFLEAGWDFVGETENGTDDIWWILEGQDYPRLWWESAEEIKE